MKKIIALVLAIVMMAAISVPAFAAETVPHCGADKEIGNSGSSRVTYEQGETYTVTIPDEIAFGHNEAVTATISVTYALQEGKHLKVEVSGTYETLDQKSGFVMEHKAGEDDKALFSMKNATGPNGTATADPAYTLENDQIIYLEGQTRQETVQSHFRFDIVHRPTATGLYEGSLTFTVEIPENNQNA